MFLMKYLLPYRMTVDNKGPLAACVDEPKQGTHFFHGELELVWCDILLHMENKEEEDKEFIMMVFLLMLP